MLTKPLFFAESTLQKTNDIFLFLSSSEVCCILSESYSMQTRQELVFLSLLHHNVESRADDVHTALHTTICRTIKRQSPHEGQTCAH